MECRQVCCCSISQTKTPTPKELIRTTERQPNELVTTIILTAAWWVWRMTFIAPSMALCRKKKNNHYLKKGMRKEEKSTLEASTGLFPAQTRDTQCEARHRCLPRPSWSLLSRYRRSGRTQDRAWWGIIFTSSSSSSDKNDMRLQHEKVGFVLTLIHDIQAQKVVWSHIRRRSRLQQLVLPL